MSCSAPLNIASILKEFFRSMLELMWIAEVLDGALGLRLLGKDIQSIEL